MKKYRKIFSRVVLIGFVIALQIAVLVVVMLQFQALYQWVIVAFALVTALQIIKILNSDRNPAYKMAWIIPMIIFFYFGGIVYLIAGGKRPARKLRKKLEKSQEFTDKYIPSCDKELKEIAAVDYSTYNITYYLNSMGFPIYKDTYSKYFPLGEDCYASMVAQLKKAKHFIFLEYFIISDGIMWDTIFKVLKQKAFEGVDVRLIYDDMGNISTLPKNFVKTMERNGIKCICFNPFRPVISAVVNNRDHRKIMVIDGHTGFTGGINLADEYINEINRFGHWKDTAVMLQGEAVWNLTLLFLTTWNGLRKTDKSYNLYRPSVYSDELDFAVQSNGYVCPYGDTPLDNEPFAENVYIDIINKAQQYIYIMTPYLIIDNEMIKALILAAKKGVDVRIMTPGKPDKKTVFQVTRSHYPQLIQGGVKIYEYTPGFVHAKNFVCDDCIATVGSINMDYRSLYLHFENGCFFYNSSIVNEIRDDFIEAQKVSRAISVKNRQKHGIFQSTYYAILRLFSPLM